ncbi:MAG TPA: signal peptidase I [Tepidimicrobium sp.]|nr:signal peptidase I [Tepidimicrobium sp.]
MEWIKSIILAVVIALFIKAFVFNTTYVLGNSMYPTLHERDRLFANKIPLYFSGPKRGDIVVLSAPDTDDKDYIKRVIGIEGDVVAIIDGQVYLNGNLLKEDYVGEGSYTDIYGENYWEVPEEHVFVLGDNRDEGASKDSRFFGPVPVATIKGITSFRYFPIDENFGKIK